MVTSDQNIGGIVVCRNRRNDLVTLYPCHDVEPGASEVDSIWQKISESSVVFEGTPDPEAIRMAYKVHVSAQPILTILFGSRARGRQGLYSDIDILVVNEKATRSKIELEYNPQDYPLQILQMGWDDFADEEQWADGMVTPALQQGVVFADNPKMYVSRFVGDEAEIPRYRWASYDYLRNRCRAELNAMYMCIVEDNHPSLNELNFSEEELRRHLCNHARTAVDFAIRTVIFGAGGYVKVDDGNTWSGLAMMTTRIALAHKRADLMNELSDRMEELSDRMEELIDRMEERADLMNELMDRMKTNPKLVEDVPLAVGIDNSNIPVVGEFNTVLSIKEYQDALFLGMSNEELLESTMRDCKEIRSHAMRLKRNATKRMKESAGIRKPPMRISTR